MHSAKNARRMNYDKARFEETRAQHLAEEATALAAAQAKALADGKGPLDLDFLDERGATTRTPGMPGRANLCHLMSGSASGRTGVSTNSEFVAKMKALQLEGGFD